MNRNPREVWRGRSPSMKDPQRRHVRRGVLSARKMCRWHIFSEERAGRPWESIFAEQNYTREVKPISLLRSKNTYLTDLPPASEARGKSAQGVALAGEGFPRQSTFYKIIVAFFLLFLYNRRAVMRMGSVRCSGVNPVRSERKQQ